MFGISNVIWAAVIASLLTLGGVLLTNLGNNRRLIAQLKHDKDIRDREREMSLKKDVYLAAAESITISMSAIARLHDITIPHDVLGKEISAASSSIGKIQVVGNEETVKATSIFSREHGTSYLKLLVKRIPIVNIKQEISSLDEMINKSIKERDRLVEAMRELNKQGNTDKTPWDALNNIFEFEGTQIEKHSIRRNNLFKDLQDRQIILMKDCIAAYNNLYMYLISAMISIRKELELPLDEEKYRQFVESERGKQEAVLEEFIAKIKDPKGA